MENNEYEDKILKNICELVIIEKALEEYIREESELAPDEQDDALGAKIIKAMALTMGEISVLDQKYRQSLAEHDSGTYKEANGEN